MEYMNNASYSSLWHRITTLIDCTTRDGIYKQRELFISLA